MVGRAEAAGSPQACAVECQAGVAFMSPRDIRWDRLAERVCKGTTIFWHLQLFLKKKRRLFVAPDSHAVTSLRRAKFALLKKFCIFLPKKLQICNHRLINQLRGHSWCPVFSLFRSIALFIGDRAFLLVFLCRWLKFAKNFAIKCTSVQFFCCKICKCQNIFVILQSNNDTRLFPNRKQ